MIEDRKPLGTGARQAWSPSSWRSRPVEQAPTYPDEAALAAVERQIAGFPPLVFAGEARKLKRSLGEVAAGRAFLLQGGDCAEAFAEHAADTIRDSASGSFCRWPSCSPSRAASPVVKIGRIAGQFAKPRSSPSERIVDDVELPSYRGDIVNGIEFDPAARIARSAAPARRLSPIGRDAESATRLRDRRLCQPRERASVDAGLREGQPAIERATARSPTA